MKDTTTQTTHGSRTYPGIELILKVEGKEMACRLAPEHVQAWGPHDNIYGVANEHKVQFAAQDGVATITMKSARDANFLLDEIDRMQALRLRVGDSIAGIHLILYEKPWPNPCRRVVSQDVNVRDHGAMTYFMTFDPAPKQNRLMTVLRPNHVFDKQLFSLHGRTLPKVMVDENRVLISIESEHTVFVMADSATAERFKKDVVSGDATCVAIGEHVKAVLWPTSFKPDVVRIHGAEALPTYVRVILEEFGAIVIEPDILEIKMIFKDLVARIWPELHAAMQ